VPRLHGFRPESWDGIVFANLETGCFRNIRGGADNDAEVAAAYDSTYAAWIRGIKQAWPDSLVFGYFLPGNSTWYMPDWPASSSPPEPWQALVARQTETLAAVDGLAPELYFPPTQFCGTAMRPSSARSRSIAEP
jgi:hypothetical protein